MTTPVNITRHARRRAVRGSATACLLAVAARDQWGGIWHVTGRGATHRVSEGAPPVHYRHTAGSLLALVAFDLGWPLVPARVQLRKSRFSSRTRRALRRSVLGSVAFGGTLICLGVVLPVVLAAAAVIACLGVAVFARRRIRRDAPASLPSVRELRAMPREQRQAVLGITERPGLPGRVPAPVTAEPASLPAPSPLSLPPAGMPALSRGTAPAGD